MEIQLPNPCYIMDEEKLRSNLRLIRDVMNRADVEIILAFKAFALWKSFPIFREYIEHTTASSYNEARMAYEQFGSRAHTYSPAYEEDTFVDMLRYSSHLTFNSLSQYERFVPLVEKWNTESLPEERVSLGLRVNPEYSEIETELYNPCAVGSRFGVLGEGLPESLPSAIEGLHVHTHCESDSFALQRSWQHINQKFAPWLAKVRWLNLGGGHLMTRKGYDVEHLIGVLKEIHAEYPHLHIIMEPGSAFAWQTGVLLARVVDVVSNNGIKTAILNVSFTCHMPDCLEMPYMPVVRGAEIVSPVSAEEAVAPCVYRLGGNSCLSGDVMGCWRFPEELKVGDEIVFEDMIHYTTVKTNMFNGINHPALAVRHLDGSIEVYRKFGYEDYLSRMC